MAWRGFVHRKDGFFGARVVAVCRFGVETYACFSCLYFAGPPFFFFFLVDLIRAFMAYSAGGMRGFFRFLRLAGFVVLELWDCDWPASFAWLIGFGLGGFCILYITGWGQGRRSGS